jgi:hypothetical protein
LNAGFFICLRASGTSFTGFVAAVTGAFADFFGSGCDFAALFFAVFFFVTSVVAVFAARFAPFVSDFFAADALPATFFAADFTARPAAAPFDFAVF